MTFQIYDYAGDPRKIDKTSLLGQGVSMTGTCKQPVDVVRPEITVQDYDPNANYAYIAEFGRYYWITEAKAINNDLFTLYLKSDPLTSFRNDILGLACYVERSELADNQSPYANDNLCPFNVYTDVAQHVIGTLNFNLGKYDVLITAG